MNGWSEFRPDSRAARPRTDKNRNRGHGFVVRPRPGSGGITVNRHAYFGRRHRPRSDSVAGGRAEHRLHGERPVGRRPPVPEHGPRIVGQAPRGAVLEVTRDIGSWVKVTWPEAPDGIGYVHRAWARLAQRATREERLAATFASLPPPEPVDMPLLTADQQRRRSICPRRGQIYVPAADARLRVGRSADRHEWGHTGVRVHVAHLVAQAARRAARLVADDDDEHAVARAAAVDAVRAERHLLAARLRRR